MSITSAIEQSDVVIVPIYNQATSIKSGLNTIAEAMNLNKNIVVIATKLKKRGKHDQFKSWTDSEDFKNISNHVESKFDDDIPVLPLKLSEVFDTIFEKEKSIAQLMDSWSLYKYTLRDVSQQFNDIYQLIDTYDAEEK